jgi:molybdopterin synthase sulfur carrier subunit
MTFVRIPPTLRADVGGARELEASGDTVGDVIDDLVERYPPLRDQLLQNGGLASFVNVFLGGDRHSSSGHGRWKLERKQPRSST